MKKYLLLFILVLFIGCGEDGDQSNLDSLEDDCISNCNELIENDDDGDQSTLDNLNGDWVSNCYELTEADGGAFIAYTIDEYSFSNGSYTLQAVYYNDQDCTTLSGGIDSYFGDYEIKENLTSSEGKNVTHISVNQASADWPEGIEPASYEAVFYINGDELTLGYYNNGVDPELYTSIIYSRE